MARRCRCPWPEEQEKEQEKGRLAQPLPCPDPWPRWAAAWSQSPWMKARMFWGRVSACASGSISGRSLESVLSTATLGRDQLTIWKSGVVPAARCQPPGLCLAALTLLLYRLSFPAILCRRVSQPASALSSSTNGTDAVCQTRVGHCVSLRFLTCELSFWISCQFTMAVRVPRYDAVCSQGTCSTGKGMGEVRDLSRCRNPEIPGVGGVQRLW